MMYRYGIVWTAVGTDRGDVSHKLPVEIREDKVCICCYKNYIQNEEASKQKFLNQLAEVRQTEMEELKSRVAVVLVCFYSVSQ